MRFRAGNSIAGKYWLQYALTWSIFFRGGHTVRLILVDVINYSAAHSTFCYGYFKYALLRLRPKQSSRKIKCVWVKLTTVCCSKQIWTSLICNNNWPITIINLVITAIVWMLMCWEKYVCVIYTLIIAWYVPGLFCFREWLWFSILWWNILQAMFVYMYMSV